jgi:hypothetical protein
MAYEATWYRSSDISGSRNVSGLGKRLEPSHSGSGIMCSTSEDGLVNKRTQLGKIQSRYKYKPWSSRF